MGYFTARSLTSIFARTARYWVTSYVGNVLWGPPGWRDGRRGRGYAVVPARTKNYGGEKLPPLYTRSWDNYGNAAPRAAYPYFSPAGRLSSVRAYSPRPAAVKSNGGLRGGATKCWRR